MTRCLDIYFCIKISSFIKLFLQIDVDDNPALATDYALQSTPTFIYFKNGEIVDALIGSSEFILRQIIERRTVGVGRTRSYEIETGSEISS